MGRGPRPSALFSRWAPQAGKRSLEAGGNGPVGEGASPLPPSFLTVLGYAVVGAAVSLAVGLRGFAADAAALFDSGSPMAAVARTLAGQVGEHPALLILAGVGGAVSGGGLRWSLGEVGARREWLAVAALLSPALLTGTQHGLWASWSLGLAAAALSAWPVAPVRAAVVTGAIALFSPPAAVACALAGFVLRPGAGPVVLAGLAATLGERGAIDVTGLAAVSVWRGASGLGTAGVLVIPALVALGGPWRLRIAGILAAVLAFGPLVVPPSASGSTLPIPLPALPFALLGAETGWMGAGVVAVAALTIGAMASSPRRAALCLALLAAEGLASVARAPSPLPVATPCAVDALGERSGVILYLPVGLVSVSEPVRAPLWRHQAKLHGRAIYADARSVTDVDPILGEPGVIALSSLLHPEAGWLIPPLDGGTVLRALGVTELVLDRAALDRAALAKLDPVLARLYGPPQRDVAAGIDLWRIEAVGERNLPNPPHLRQEGDDGTTTWLTVEELLASGRQPTPPTPVEEAP